ncbi:PilZ domain-containing protein [Pelagibacterium halotolerans]|uniref:PilZ domain-containing protein n=1 Tax=Pelagibacterium halotolerans TaxID=531813 RepID=UPI00384A7017
MADIGAVHMRGHDAPFEERRIKQAALQPGGRSMGHMLLTGGGGTFECTIVDLSLSGASLATTARFRVGTSVQVEHMPAVVTRHHKTGLAVSFVSSVDLGALAHRFGLTRLASLMGC